MPVSKRNVIQKTSPSNGGILLFKYEPAQAGGWVKKDVVSPTKAPGFTESRVKSQIRLQKAVDLCDGHAAFADGGASSFDGAGADIARGENFGKTGFESAGFAVGVLPLRRGGDLPSGLDKAFFIALNVGGNLLRTKLSTDHGKDGSDAFGARFAGLQILQFDLL